MKIRFYGRLADRMGACVDYDAPPASSVGEIREHFRSACPDAAAEMLRSRAILGDRVAADGDPIGSAREIEFLPPVSGG